MFYVEDQVDKKQRMYQIIDIILSGLLKLFILLAIFSYAIAYWPNYEKKIYQATEPVTQEILDARRQEASNEGVFWAFEYNGYPTSGIKTEMKTYKQFQDLKYEPVCLEVDVKDLEPTGLYEKVSDNPSSYGSGPQYTTSYLTTLFNRSKAIYAQYYALELFEGSHILVLLNDTAIDIPQEGKFQLPYASVGKLSMDAEGVDVYKLIQKYNLKYDDYYREMDILDAASWWMFEEIELTRVYDQRMEIFGMLLITGIVGVIGTFVFALILGAKSK